MIEPELKLLSVDQHNACQDVRDAHCSEVISKNHAYF